jgi:folate-binding protein YgfZ
MVTNNIKDLPLNHGNHNFVLSAQGRIQGDLYAYVQQDRILLDTEQSQVESLLKILNHYIIMDDVELADISEKLTAIGIQGPQATEILKRAGIEPSCSDPLAICDVNWNGVQISVRRLANEDFVDYELWLAPEDAPRLWDSLISAGAKPVGTDALEKFRVLAGAPKFGVDIRQRELPQETGQTDALNFSKGCYIGQEIVERIRSQGNLHRNFTGFLLDGAIEPGTKIMRDEKQVGEITSAATVPTKDGGIRHLALGYIRREVGGIGTKIHIGSAEAKLAALPFKLS